MLLERTMYSKYANQIATILDDEDVYAPEMDVVDLRRKVGMVFQKPNPFPKSMQLRLFRFGHLFL